MSVISDIKMILENADAMCITDAKTYTEQKARIRDAKNYVCEMECVRADAIREFAELLIERFEEEFHNVNPYVEKISINIVNQLADMKKGE